jgi:tubulin--tyrosine ligase
VIHEEVPLYYYYPQHPDGYASEKSDVRRALKQNERKEWILLGGTPATCSSVGLRNLYPGKIDLVVSGPNFGRNTSSAFALSS